MCCWRPQKEKNTVNRHQHPRHTETKNTHQQNKNAPKRVLRRLVDDGDLPLEVREVAAVAAARAGVQSGDDARGDVADQLGVAVALVEQTAFARGVGQELQVAVLLLWLLFVVCCCCWLLWLLLWLLLLFFVKARAR